jgi:hypothetical protein
MRKEDEEFTAEARSLPIDANGGRVARAKAQRRRGADGEEKEIFLMKKKTKKPHLHRSWDILSQAVLGADRCGMLLPHRRHFLVSHSGLGMAGAKQRQNGPCLSNR